MGLHGCHFFLPLLLGTVLLGPPADAVRDAGQGCPAGWGGGAGRRGEREAPDCQSVRRSFPSIQTGEVVVAPSRVSPLAQFRHTFPKPFRSAPHVLASVNGFVADVSPGNAGRWDAVNASFVVTIRSTGRAGFSANIYRTDASPVDMTDGWHGPLLVHYVAWDYFANASGPGVGATSKGRARAAGERGREGEVGILFGSWTVDASQTAPPGAPWVVPAGRFRPEDYGATVTPHKAASQPGVDGAGWGEGLDGGGPAGEHRDDGDMPSELAAYGGGQPEVVRIAFGTSFGEPPRLLVGARLTGPHDRQAVLALTVAGVTTEGCEVHVARVDQSWAVQALALDYIAWLPSYDMVTAPDMADPAARAYNGTGALRGGRILASSLPAAESGACAGNCADRQWSRDLDPYVLPRAQFGGHVLPPPVPITAGRTEYTHPDARWGGGSLAAGMGLGKRGARLPSSVQYQLRFDFKDIFAARRTGFNFTRPPWLLVSARIASASRPEHAQATPETVSVSVVSVTARDFVVNVFRVDRHGPAWPDVGGRGWLRSLELDWLAWEPPVEDITVLAAGQSTAASVERDRYTVFCPDGYTFFRVDVFDHTHDVIIDLTTNESTPRTINLDDSPMAVHAAIDESQALGGSGAAPASSGRAWLPHYVFTVAGPPTADSGRIVKVEATAPPSSRTVTGFLRLLNEGLVAADVCHNGGRDWTGDDPQQVWERAASCRLEHGADSREEPERGNGHAWPFAEAFAYIEAEARWVQMECAGVGCRHRLPLRAAPLLMLASTQVHYPTREFLGTRLPYGGAGAGGGTDAQEGGGWRDSERVQGVREVADVWVSDFLDSAGGMRLHIYASDDRWRSGRLYVGVLGLDAAEFNITAHVGRVVPLGTEAVGKRSVARLVPYVGRMLTHRKYSGRVAAGEWVYFRLTLAAHDINANTAATVITVAHAAPQQEVAIYLRKDEAPLDNQTLGLPLAAMVLVNESGYAAATLAEDPVANTIAGWAVHSPGRALGTTECGAFGRILGGPGLLAHASALQRDFAVPRVHTEVHVQLEFVKIDLWDGHTARLLVDGAEVWRQTWHCDLSIDGMCGGSSQGDRDGAGNPIASNSTECGIPAWPDDRVHIDVRVPHVSPVLTLRVETDLPRDERFAVDRSWGIGALTVTYQHSSRRSAQWVDLDTSLYASNQSLPPTEALDVCTPANPTAGPGCVWGEGGARVCEGGTKCSSRSLMYRLGAAGEYFVGVYGLAVPGGAALAFDIGATVHQNAYARGAEVPDAWDDGGGGREPWVSVGRRAAPLALIETYPRVSVAYGAGVSTGLIGVPATFYIRAKDKYGNVRTTGGDAYRLSFQGPCGIAQDTGQQHPACVNASATYRPGEPEPATVANVRTFVFDLGDGAYLASYVLTVGGSYAMSVRLHGQHIRGSPFAVTAWPDVSVLAAATGATFAGSHVRISGSERRTHAVGPGQYVFFLVDVDDMSSDLVLLLDTLSGQTDVLVSNTRTHPTHNSPADVQWRSEWQTLAASKGGVHRLHISYADPLFLAGPHYIAVYGRENASFGISAVVEQVARQMELGRDYAAVVSSTHACAADADCAAVGDSRYACINARCSQRRRFRLRPHVPAHAYYFRVTAVPPAAGFEASHCPSPPAWCPCAPLAVFLAKDQPYPNGTLVASATAPDTPTAAEAAGPGEFSACSDRYTLASLATEVGAAYYLSVEPANHSGNSTARFVVRAATAMSAFEQPAAVLSKSRAAAHGRPARAPSRSPPRDEHDHTRGPVSALSLGVQQAGVVGQWERAFYAVEVADTQSELVCRVVCSSGKVLLFMSTDTAYPSRARADLVQWRSDDAISPVSSVDEGKADVSLRARPDDKGFKVGAFYLSVYGAQAAAYTVTCSVSEATRVPTVRVGRHYGGAVAAAGGYTFFRLLTEGISSAVTATVTLTDRGALNKAPPLALFLQKTNPAAAQTSLGRCGTGAQARTECLVHTSNTTCVCTGLNAVDAANSSVIAVHACPWGCNQPFYSDMDRIGYLDYSGRSWLTAKLQPGTSYYVAVHAAVNASHYALSVPVAFRLSLAAA